MPGSPIPGAPLPNPFPVARYRLHCCVERALHLPDYAGSTLRGVLGHALKDLVCVTRQPVCEPCALYRSCVYPSIFERPAPAGYPAAALRYAPNPFAVEPAGWGALDLPGGADFHFDLVLIGPALAQLPLIVRAWQQGLARNVGGGQGSARVQCVQNLESGHVIWHEDTDTFLAHNQVVALPASDSAPAQVTLDFITPLRLQQQGRVLDASTLTAGDILIALLRRAALLLELQLGRTTGWYFDDLHAQARASRGNGTLRWRDWTRYSNRQQRAMTLGGLIGRYTIADIADTWWPLLYLGQWLHVGKNASFGMGGYRIGVAG